MTATIPSPSSLNKVAAAFKECAPDYSWAGLDVMTDTDGLVTKLKYIINHKLSEADKTIIILYAECRSSRKLGEILGLSHATAQKEVFRIRMQILDELDRYGYDKHTL